MSAIENVRRELRDKSWLAWSTAPFAGAVHDFKKPMRERLNSRQYVSPYYFEPAKPGAGRGFYQSAKGLACDRAGSTFDLRLEYANDVPELRYSRLARIDGYFADRFGDTTLTPIIARLPHGRGFLAGWTMGKGMAACVDGYVWPDAESAARGAHDMAERDAERNRESNDSDDSDDSDD